MPRVRVVLLSGVIVALIAVIGYAMQRELALKVVTAPIAAGMGEPERRPLSAQEEAYAAALWSIHSQVKLYAVQMSFAGIAYETEDHDLGHLAAKVRPLGENFKVAIAQARALEVPGSMQKVQDRYLGALASYENASAEMMKAAQDGRDDRLAAAQSMSERASEDLLRVGDVLWPGEYKPN